MAYIFLINGMFNGMYMFYLFSKIKQIIFLNNKFEAYELKLKLVNELFSSREFNKFDSKCVL